MGRNLWIFPTIEKKSRFVFHFVYKLFISQRSIQNEIVTSLRVSLAVLFERSIAGKKISCIAMFECHFHLFLTLKHQYFPKTACALLNNYSYRANRLGREINSKHAIMTWVDLEKHT